MRRLALLIVLAASAALAPARAQELNCQITLNRDAITGTEFDFLDEFREEVFRYVNNRAWTDDVFRAEERIDCQIQITFTAAPSQTSFVAQLVVQASRPIYGTAQRTTTMRVADNTWEFAYARGQSLIYDPNRFNPLTSVLDYYANLILGYDYDTFSPLGGTRFFERASRIAELSRTTPAGAPGEGWFGQGVEDRARFTLVNELLDPVFQPVRQAQYDYHFEVLDHFVVRHEQAWADAIEVLTALHELYQQNNRRRYVTDVFFGAKYQELASLLADSPQRNQAYALLSEMDSAHLGTYDGLVNSR
ncbi:DUF4835 family protein [Rubrivirga marina]|uniref:type IX secretion system protein PorD n=1 Tax=Rubrivirga marina TaxID=1196024 RepID=UPI0015CA1A30|nr:DUF4835 family protein [Rubrivirga marina]